MISPSGGGSVPHWHWYAFQWKKESHSCLLLFLLFLFLLSGEPQSPFSPVGGGSPGQCRSAELFRTRGDGGANEGSQGGEKETHSWRHVPNSWHPQWHRAQLHRAAHATPELTGSRHIYTHTHCLFDSTYSVILSLPITLFIRSLTLHHFFPLSNQTMFSQSAAALQPQTPTSILRGLHSVCCLAHWTLWVQEKSPFLATLIGRVQQFGKITFGFSGQKWNEDWWILSFFSKLTFSALPNLSKMRI